MIVGSLGKFGFASIIEEGQYGVLRCVSWALLQGFTHQLSGTAMDVDFRPFEKKKIPEFF